MLHEALQFWDLQEYSDQFTLVLPNMHNIMHLTEDHTHIAHRITDYFEIHKSKRAVLYLIK
jgi:sulfur relay (sulfurtransferase) DsrC/TusE family protein